MSPPIFAGLATANGSESTRRLPHKSLQPGSDSMPLLARAMVSGWSCTASPELKVASDHARCTIRSSVVRQVGKSVCQRVAQSLERQFRRVDRRQHPRGHRASRIKFIISFFLSYATPRFAMRPRCVSDVVVHIAVRHPEICCHFSNTGIALLL